MNFFKSVFADDPDPPSISEPESSSSDSTISLPQQLQPSDQDSASDSDLPAPPPEPSPQSFTDNSGGGLWTFGSLVKTLTTRSESVIETYRRDLKEFSSGLKNETLTLREVANRAMKELPSSIEVTATKAQGAIDSIGSSVAEIIAQGKETLLSADLDSSDESSGRSSSNSKEVVSSVGRYSRFDAQLRVIQCDVNTYLQEPESGNAGDDYEKWRLGFKLDEKGEEIEGLIGGENGVMSEIYKKLVPDSVDHETFWCRYYYRVHRLEQAASVRAKLVKRVASMDEEELSWDVDDEEEEDEDEEVVDEPVKKLSDNVSVESGKLRNEDVKVDDSSKNVEGGKVEAVSMVGEIQVRDDKIEELVADNEEGGEKSVDVNEPISDENAVNENKVLPKDTPKDEQLLTKDSMKVVLSEDKAEGKKSSQKKDDVILTNHQSQEEEELDWDEIEDLGSGDEKKVIPSGSSNSAEVRKRLSVAEVDVDDEDLSWDIEDDDHS